MELKGFRVWVLLRDGVARHWYISESAANAQRKIFCKYHRHSKWTVRVALGEIKLMPNPYSCKATHDRQTGETGWLRT